MQYPSLQDYNEAVQNPRRAFSDPELQVGRAELTKLGLPFARAGGFASVYKFECGHRTFAVRCFKRDVPDQQARYQRISQYLQSIRIPYTVDFTFLEQGIRVKGSPYPILKMAWIQGEALNTCIEKNLGNPGVLLSLARRWVRMMETLRQANVAHGDLQDGNVLVVGGDYRLIDYDGMYVPALNGRSSNEVGLPHYQHPKRTEFDFGPGLDNFSAWVIYLSLLAVSVDPQLWRKAQAGDNCLLFRKADFERPDHSKVFRLLERSGNQSLQLVVTQFRSFLDLAPLQVPPLGGQLVTGTSPTRAATAGASGPSWLKDHIRPPGARPTAMPVAGNSSDSVTIPLADPSWIIDHQDIGLQSGQPIGFEYSPVLERITLVASLGCLAVLLLFVIPLRTTASAFAAGFAVDGVLLLNFFLWIRRFRTDPGNLALAELRAKFDELSVALNKKRKAIRAVEREREDILARFELQSHAFETNLRKNERREQEGLNAEWSQRAAILTSIQRRRQQADMQEQAETRRIQDSSAAQITSLKQQITALTTAEYDEVKTTLQRQQAEHIDASLRCAKLYAASISGIGSELTAKLIAAGIETAADVSFQRITRIGGFKDARATAIVAWRNGIEARARSIMPQALATQEVDQIRYRYAQKRSQLQALLARVQPEAVSAEVALRNEYKELRAQFDVEESHANSQATAQVQRIRETFQPQADEIKSDLAILKACVAEELDKVNARMSQVKPELARLNYERGKLNRQLENATRLICVSKYLKRIVFLAG